MRRLLWMAMLWSLAWPVPAQTLLVAMEEADNRPFEYLDDQGNLTGFHTEIVRAVAKALGWEVSFQRMPWGRAQLSLANGKVDAVTYMGKTAERMKYAVFLDGNQLDVERVTLFVRREDAARIHYIPPVSSMMNRWRFGAPHGYFLGQEIADAVAAGLPLDQHAQNQAQLFGMLVAHRIDVAVAEKLALQLVEPEMPDVAAHVAPVTGAVFSGNPMYIAFRNKGDGPQLAKQFAAAYAKWRHGDVYPWLIARFKVYERVPDSFIPK